jgi:hypothetical protein
MSSIKTLRQFERGGRLFVRTLKSNSSSQIGQRARRTCQLSPANHRQFSWSAVQNQIYTPPSGDVQLEQKPLGQFLLEKFEKFGDRVALVKLIFNNFILKQHRKHSIILMI